MRVFVLLLLALTLPVQGMAAALAPRVACPMHGAPVAGAMTMEDVAQAPAPAMPPCHGAHAAASMPDATVTPAVAVSTDLRSAASPAHPCHPGDGHGDCAGHGSVCAGCASCQAGLSLMGTIDLLPPAPLPVRDVTPFRAQDLRAALPTPIWRPPALA